MAKLQDVIKKALAEVQGDLQADVAAGIKEATTAKSVGTTVVKAVGTIGKVKLVGDDQERLAEIGFIAKSLRGAGGLLDVDLKDLSIRAKAVGVTTDVAEILPDGFTGLLLRDIQDELNVAKLFPMRTIKGGVAHDTIAMHGIQAFLTSEAATGTDSSEAYQTFVATTKKVLAIVRKSYEVIDDSLIDLAGEVRIGIVRAIADAIEGTVVNGDIAGAQDGTTYGSSAPERAANGIRFHGLNKITVAGGGVDWTSADKGEGAFLKMVTDMQLAGGNYLDERAVMRGDVVMILSQTVYGRIRAFDSYKTVDKIGNLATLLGGKIKTIYDIPFIVSSSLAKVDVAGLVDSGTPANNIQQAIHMFNVDTMRLSTNGSVMSENDRDITNQTFIWTGSLRFGFASIYDSTEAAINTVTTNQLNVVSGIDLDS